MDNFLWILHVKGINDEECRGPGQERRYGCISSAKWPQMPSLCLVNYVPEMCTRRTTESSNNQELGT